MNTYAHDHHALVLKTIRLLVRMRMQYFAFEFLLVFEARPQWRAMMARTNHNRIKVFALRFVGVQVSHRHIPFPGRIVVVRLFHFGDFSSIDQMFGQIEFGHIRLEIFELNEEN